MVTLILTTTRRTLNKRGARSVAAAPLRTPGYAGNEKLDHEHAFDGCPRFDLIVHGGTIIDGTGKPGFRGDVGVNNGKITAIGDLSSASAGQTLDAADAVVTPGFIDIHSHSDYTLLVDGRASSQVSQGVTTELIGNCGHGCAPIGPRPTDHVPNVYGYTGDLPLTWSTTAQFLESLEAAKPAVNVATLVPFGNLRIAVMDDPGTAASESELSQMTQLLEEGLDAGAYGLSFGLEYKAESSAPESELIALAAVSAKREGLLAVHTANKDETAVEAVADAIGLARSSGSKLQVSHVVPRRNAAPGSLDRIIEMLEREGEASGTRYDVHTRLHGITNLAAALPQHLQAAAPNRLRSILALEGTAGAVRNGQGVIQSFARGGWQHVFLRSSRALPELAGKSFAEIAEILRVDPWEAVLRVLSESADDVAEPICMCLSYKETDIVRTGAQPHCLVGSDATALCTDGPLAGREFHGAYTWAGWAFSRLSTGATRLPIEAIVKKLSADPAEQIRLSDRGRIERGLAADLAVISPSDFRETGTLERPNQYCTGVRHVVINGESAMRDGRLTGSGSGRVLRNH